ncbi:MAG: HNH endonuclease [Sulfuritalea sp.]|nr:HNH endonuclease [Sulfuritalea sp.]
MQHFCPFHVSYKELRVVTRTQILAAFRRFEKGDRPSSHRKPKRWFVQGNSSRLYPLKLIYSLATELPPPRFHTNDAKRELTSIGFIVVDVTTADEVGDHFEDAVRWSLADPARRRERLSKASAHAPEQFVIQRVFQRNPDVVAEVLSRAKGVCQACKKPAPFLKKSDGEPYLEAHHVKQLADGGEDTVENAIAVCPNCHRKAHYG